VRRDHLTPSPSLSRRERDHQPSACQLPKRPNPSGALSAPYPVLLLQVVGQPRGGARCQCHDGDLRIHLARRREQAGIGNDQISRAMMRAVGVSAIPL
jgi:hypothetical protein